jgi:hypothetical protein
MLLDEVATASVPYSTALVLSRETEALVKTINPDN